jgi:hypothetical protein
MLSSKTVGRGVSGLIIECTNCHAKYQYDEERFERKPSKKIKCAKCQQIFEIFNPAFSSKAEGRPVGESTALKREIKAPAANPVPAAEQSTSEAPIPAKPVSPLQMPAGKRLSLAIIDGPDAGNVYRIEKPRVVIGRSGADLTLNDTDASRQHAAVEIRETEFTLHDLGSTNGTIFEGEKVTAPITLQNHSEFVVGSSTLMLIVTEEA